MHQPSQPVGQGETPVLLSFAGTTYIVAACGEDSAAGVDSVRGVSEGDTAVAHRKMPCSAARAAPEELLPSWEEVHRTAIR